MMNMKRFAVSVIILSLVVGAGGMLFAAGGSETKTADVKTVVFWDQFTAEKDAAAVNSMIDLFMSKNPGIKVQTTRMFGEDLKTILKTAMSSGLGPDMVYYNTGPGDLGVLVKAGLIYDLTGAYKTYGWSNRFFDWTIDGVSFGGKIWAVPHEIEFTGVFYNKKIFTKLGLGEPKTYAEFLSTCEKIKQAGIIPINLGNKERWPAAIAYDMWINNSVPRSDLLQIFAGKSSWVRPDVVESLRLFQELADKGYFTPDANSIGYNDGNLSFFSGKAAMYLMGTWMIKNAPKNDPNVDLGMFFLPAINPAVGVRAPAALGSCYQVSSKSKNPDAALKLIDYLMNPQSVNTWLEKVNVIPPIKADLTQLKLPDPLKFSVDVLYSRYKDLGTSLYMVFTRGFDEMERAELQNLIVDKISPSDLAQKFQDSWQEGVKEGLIW